MARGKTKKQTYFAHGCVQCGWRYETGAIPREENGLCPTCRSGHPRPMWEASAAPRDCCLMYSRPVDKDERQRYDLGGPADMPWYICDHREGGCSRTFPFVNPGRAPWVWFPELVDLREELE